MKRVTKTVEIIVCSSEECAEMLGIHLRTFQRLIREGWVEGKIGRNEYDLQRVTATYLSHQWFEQRKKNQ